MDASRRMTDAEVMERYLAAWEAADYDGMAALRHPDWTLDFPQSGERIRGSDNYRAMRSNYPGGGAQVAGKRAHGSGDHWWAESTIDYPDGSIWFLVDLFELRDGLVYREVGYFGQAFEAPAWRAQWVERTSG